MVRFVRVEDPSTRHKFDVREDSYLLRENLVKRVKGVGVSKQRRPHKVFRSLPAGGRVAGQSVTQNTTADKQKQ